MLTQRQELILKTLIELYQKKKVPISSRMLAHTELEVSSATIRNELLFLDQIAFVEKVHTSSGRIPAEAGYRYYLTYLLKEDYLSSKTKQYIQQSMYEYRPYSDIYWQNFVNVLSEITECVAFVSYPRLEGLFQSFHLVPMTKNRLMLWLTTQEQGTVYEVFSVEHNISLAQFNYHLTVLNQVLLGTPLHQLSQILSEALPYVLPLSLTEQKRYKVILNQLIHQALEERFIASGYHYLYYIKELSEESRRRLIQQLDDHLIHTEAIPKLVNESYHIDLSSEWLDLEDVPLSYIQMRYDLPNATYGRMIILGSASMDYEHHLAAMKYMQYELYHQYYE